MKVSRFIFNPFGMNTYVVYDPASREAAVIDPGMTSADEEQALDRFIEREELTVKHLINTHMHLDHIFGNPYVKTKYGVGAEAGADDEFLAKDFPAQVAKYHLPIKAEPQTVDTELRDGDEIFLGTEPLKVLAVPGHSPGSIALWAPESGFVITGDALFEGSIGRTDLPRGDFSTLVNAIRAKLLTLPGATVVLPGHGPETTIAREAASNPYLI